LLIGIDFRANYSSSGRWLAQGAGSLGFVRCHAIAKDIVYASKTIEGAAVTSQVLVL
jgi:hypothetical protein